jgi:CBS domain-containing protein
MTAAEIMTENPRTMRPTDSVSEALDTLQSMHVRHLPIVDERHHLVGMLSDRDLGSFVSTFTEGAEAERMALPLSERPVSDFMTTGVVAVTPEADISEVVQLMLDERVGAIPVVDDAERVVGIVSYVDLLRLVGARPAEPTARPSAP